MADNDTPASPNTPVAPHDQTPTTPAPTRSLPRAQRLSRVQAGDASAPAAFVAPAPAAPPVPVPPAPVPIAPAPVPPAPPAEPPAPSPAPQRLTPTLQSLQPLPRSQPQPEMTTEQLTASILESTPTAPPEPKVVAPPTPAPTTSVDGQVTRAPSRVTRSKYAAPEDAPPPTTGPGVFRPLTDKLATRSVVMSILGLILCFFPLISLLGLGGGLLSRKRIRTSNGTMVGESTARTAIIIGGAGFAIGAIADVIFLIVR